MMKKRTKDKEDDYDDDYGDDDDDDDDDDCVKAHWRAAHPSIEHSTHIPWSPPWEEHPSTSATSTWVLVLKQATL